MSTGEQIELLCEHAGLAQAYQWVHLERITYIVCKRKRPMSPMCLRSCVRRSWFVRVCPVLG